MDEPIEVKLRDGTVVTIRPIHPEDRAALEEGFAKLSDWSRYLRFHSSMNSLTEAHLRYLTEVDHVDHVALGATTEVESKDVGLGVARYVRLKDDPEVAEAAVTVVDEWQGRGLGTLLLGALALSALRNGVRVFRNYVLGENTAMIRLFDELGATRIDEGGGVYEIDFVLPADPEDLPDTPAGRVFKAAARGYLPDLPPSFPPIWPEGEEQPDLRAWLDQAFGRGR